MLPDRGLDIGLAEFAGVGLCWLPPKGLAGPWFYEGDHDDYAWLRVGLGGLFNTAGLVSMGTPQTVSTEQYGFTQRLDARYGTHDRIAVTPSERFNYGEHWDGDRLVLWAEGTVRQDIAYGENLTLARRYEIEAGTSIDLDPRRGDQRGVLPDTAPDPLPLQPRFPVPAARRAASSPGLTGPSVTSPSRPSRPA